MDLSAPYASSGGSIAQCKNIFSALEEAVKTATDTEADGLGYMRFQY